jgi:hypothetical protein
MKRQKDQTHPAGSLGIAPNLGAAESRTGIPKSIIQECKRLGCEAFKANNNIDCDALLDFVRDNEQISEMLESGINVALEEALTMRAERLTKEEKLVRLRNKSIDLDSVVRLETEHVFNCKANLIGGQDGLTMKLCAITGADPVAVKEKIQERDNQFLELLSKSPLTKKEE